MKEIVKQNYGVLALGGAIGLITGTLIAYNCKCTNNFKYAVWGLPLMLAGASVGYFGKNAYLKATNNIKDRQELTFTKK